MKPFTRHLGKAVVLEYANIDTDQIIPKQFLSKVTRDGFGVHLFHDWRYLDVKGNIENPDFTLNKKEHKGASILISLDNFGCGSSREHAPWALADFGFKVIIAPSFADIFYSNSLNNGLLPAIVDNTTLNELIKVVNEDPNINIEIDLNQKKILVNGNSYVFMINDAAQDKLIKGLDAIGLTLTNIDSINAFEHNLPGWRK